MVSGHYMRAETCYDLFTKFLCRNWMPCIVLGCFYFSNILKSITTHVVYHIYKVLSTNNFAFSRHVLKFRVKQSKLYVGFKFQLK